MPKEKKSVKDTVKNMVKLVKGDNMSESDFELDYNDIVDVRKKQQKKIRTEAHIVDGDTVEASENE